MARFRRAAPPSEAGFVLLTALWLLFLGGVMAAAITAAGLNAAREARAYEARMRARLAADAAIETVVYDLLAHGPASRWRSGGSLPVADTGDQVMVEVTYESGRLDLNRTAIEDIVRLLGALDITPNERRIALAALKARRTSATGRFPAFRSLADVAGVLGATPAAWHSLAPHVTVYTGAMRPAARDATPEVMQALKLEVTSGLDDPESRTFSGEVLRIRATVVTAGLPRTRTRIVRLVGTGDKPVWWYATIDQ